MSTKNIVSVIALLGLVAGGAYYYGQLPKPAQSAAVAETQSAPTPSGTTSTSTSVKFADQSYFTFAYEIDPTKLNSLNADTKLALTGFSVNAKNNPDGSVVVSFTSTNSEYHNQQYVLKAGDKLYFIEKNLKDDQNNEEKFLADDTAVVVDQNGNVVPQGN